VLDDLTERRIVEKLADTNKLGVKILKATKTALTESIRAGTKGSAFNVAQTMASVGQQLLSGNRLEYQYPYFNPDDPSMDVNARGFIESSFMEGLTPAEFVSLMAGGREGLIDTALNTADSGHLHHMVIKTAEDIKVDRRGMVTNSYGVIFQFAYGEDALNPEYLQRVHTASGDALSFINISNEVARLNASFGFPNV
jgi:DNA-directed RNA polymerase beta' subunit